MVLAIPTRTEVKSELQEMLLYQKQHGEKLGHSIFTTISLFSKEKLKSSIICADGLRWWRGLWECECVFRKTEPAIDCGNRKRLLGPGELLKGCCDNFKAHPVSTITFKYNTHKRGGLCVIRSEI